MNFKRLLEKFLSQTRVQRQLTSVFMLALLIPVACIGFLLLYNSQQTLFNHYQEQAESDGLRVRSIMFDLTTNFYNLSEDIVTDQSLQNLLDSSWDSVSEARSAAYSYNRLTSIRQQNTSIESISVYTYNEQLAGYGDFLSITDDVRETSWFQQAASTSAIFWRTEKREDTYGNIYWELNMFRQLTLPASRSYAVLVITASNNYLKNRIDNSALKNIITVNEDPVFYSTDKEYTGKNVPVELDTAQYSYADSGILLLAGEDTMTSINTLIPYKSDDRIYVVSYNSQAVGEIRHIQTNYTLILVFAIIIPCLLMYLFIRYFSARVNTLRSAMHQASRGDYNIIDSFHGNDELSEAFRDLQMMIQEIKQKEALVYEARLKEQEQIQLGWTAKRELSKINYRIHTDAIRQNLIPAEVTTKQANAIYANEADVLNVAMFGMTARQWREQHPDLKGNIRDYATINELICLSNMENLNAVFIGQGIPQNERVIRLNHIAIQQMKVLEGDEGRKLLK